MEQQEFYSPQNTLLKMENTYKRRSRNQSLETALIILLNCEQYINAWEMERQFIFYGKSANLLCFLQLRLHLRLSFEMYELGDIWRHKPHRQKKIAF